MWDIEKIKAGNMIYFLNKDHNQEYKIQSVVIIKVTDRCVYLSSGNCTRSKTRFRLTGHYMDEIEIKSWSFSARAVIDKHTKMYKDRITKSVNDYNGFIEWVKTYEF